jgi:hypothetical protein
MSIALFLCPCTLGTATVLSGAIGAILSRWLKRRGSRVPGAIVVLGTVVLANALAVGLLYLALRSHSGFGLSLRDVRVPISPLPEGASDVNYWWSGHAGTREVADFAVSEQDFLTWTQSRGWKPRKFRATGKGYPDTRWEDPDYKPPAGHGRGVRSAEGEGIPTCIRTARGMVHGTCEEVTILNGYYFDTYLPYPQFDDSGWTVFYDLDRKRAYLVYTAF